MNILVSYNWLKEYLKTDLSPEEFAARVSLCGPSVERIHREGENLDKIVVGKILGVEKHPNADKLRLVETDLGRKKLTIVCGGSNLKEGMKVAVALSGAKVKWHGEGELVELKPTEIRGVKSEGMICAAEEIGLGEQFSKKDEKDPTSHEVSRGGRILDLSDLTVKPGTPLAEALNLKDVVFDIEVTTNRPDMMSIVGISREAGTILKSPFKMPKILPIKKISAQGGCALGAKNDAPELCSRYQAVVMEDIKIGPSPWWLKQKLASCGTRSINNVVDITNLVLWEMGQPLHAFDYEKLEGKNIIIRKAKKGEKIKALDGVEYKLTENNLVIADEKKPVAIAGVMGGEESGVTDGTHIIVLEAATFDQVSVRKTSRALNLRSESSNLFEKGLSTEATTAALARAVELVAELAGGKVANKVFDLRSKEYKPQSIILSSEKANKIIGTELKPAEMADILSRLGFSVSVKGDEIKAKAPYWREGDIENEEDLIEEVARVYGYHRLPSVLPPGALPPGGQDKIFYWEKEAKNFAVAAGYDEIISYSMISKKMMDVVHEEKAVKILNPLSVDLEYMRTCLFPGLLQTVAENENNFFGGKIFELSRVYTPLKKGELPQEESHFAGMVWGGGNLFFEAKGFAEKFLEKFGLTDYVFKDADDSNMHPARSLDIYIRNSSSHPPSPKATEGHGKATKGHGEYIGSFGEVHPVTVKNFGIASRVGFFYFYFDEVARRAKTHKSCSPIPEFPGVKRDISFVVDKKTEYAKIKEAVVAADALVAGAEPFDVYEGEGVPDNKKSIALHILFQSANRTLEAKDADAAWEKIAAVLKKKFYAEIRM